MKIPHLLVAAILVLGVGAPARADLIATIPFSGFNSWAYPLAQTGPVTGVDFFLGYQASGATAGVLGGHGWSPAIGEYNWLGQTSGTYDFTRTNTVSFDAFASRLTDGIDEVLFQGRGISLANGGFLSAANGSTDGPLLGLPAPASIDFVRLNLKNLSVTNTAAQEAGWYNFEVRGEGDWEIHGARVITPEPASLLLLSTGLVALAARRRSRARRSR